MNASHTTWREPQESGTAPRRIPVRVLAISGIAAVLLAAVVGWFGAIRDNNNQAQNLDTTTVSDIEAAKNDGPIIDEKVPVEQQATETTLPALQSTVETPKFETPTTIEQSAGPPLADLSGNDFNQITGEFIRFDQWLREHPNAQLVETIFERNSPAWGHVFHEMETALPATPQQFEVQSMTTEALRGDRVKVTAKVTYDGRLLTDNITFHRQADQTWRAIDRVVN